MAKLSDTQKEMIKFWETQIEWRKNYAKKYPDSKQWALEGIKDIKKHMKNIKRSVFLK